MPSSLPRILVTIFLAGISSGVFWTGLFFLTTDHYAFSVERNLLLAACMGAASALGARCAGPLCVKWSARSVLTGTFAVWAGCALLPVWITTLHSVVWLSALLGAACSSVVWSVAESYLGAGRQAAELRRAIGLFSLSWMPAAALALLMPVALLTQWLHTDRPLLVVAALASLAALASARRFDLAPGHAAPHAVDVVSRAAEAAPHAAEAAANSEYPLLLRSATVLLPIGYVVSSTLAPVLPQRFIEVGLTLDGASGAAIWLLARAATLLWMWLIHSWHGRWETLVVGASALGIGLGLVLLGSSPALLIVGLGVYGAGMGISYYAALYYNLVVGHAAVESSGKFELVIGLAYAVGPLLGLLAHALVAPSTANLTTVHLTLFVACLLAPAALRPYLHALGRRFPL